MLRTPFNSLWATVVPALVVLVLQVPARLAAQPDDTSRFRAHNLETLNSDADDYAPYASPNGRFLFYTSSRTGSADLYRAIPDGETWTAPVNVSGEDVNTVLDEGSLSSPAPRHALLFNLDPADLAKLTFDRTAILTASDRAVGLGDADIHIAEFDAEGESLHDIRAVHELNTGEWDAQGTIASDGSYLIYSSNRPGGRGNMDLYIAMRRSDGSFGDPRNMGQEINTGGNEFSPFLAPDGRTLFFASTGHEGFGGADLFMSRRSEDGRWGRPRNLGDVINTKYNENFFYGIDRVRCYFASDRPGGKGGLDLYEGGPNVFMPGLAKLRVRLIDTTSGRAVPGTSTVTETQLQRALGTQQSAKGVMEFPVLDGLSYRVEATSPGFDPAQPATVNDVPESGAVEVVLKFGSPPPPPPIAAVEPPPLPPPPAPPEPPLPPMPVVFTFDVDGKVVPFFVSGYYRLNTKTSLVDLRRRQNADLRDQTYITDVNRDADAFEKSRKNAAEVEHLLHDFIDRCQELYFPGFVDYLNRRGPGPKEYIQITVYGFADPRPIIGAYTEQPVSFLDSAGHSVTVRSWELLDNFKLAGLRAHYAQEYFDNIFRKGRARKVYAQLMQQNLVRWRDVSGSVDDLDALTRGDDLGTKRRIVVEMRLMKEGEEGSGESYGGGVGTSP